MSRLYIRPLQKIVFRGNFFYFLEKSTGVTEIEQYPKKSRVKPHDSTYLEFMTKQIRQVHLHLLQQWLAPF